MNAKVKEIAENVLNRKFKDFKSSPAYGEVVILAAEYLDLLEQNRWIPVSERLPEEPGAYLVYRIENPFPTTRPYFHDGTWGSGATITHWKPLPNVPEDV